ncbi:MAG: aminoglycoside phosphotransferase family protein [Chloroflexi bacterium]|nr:aminoglycoside phosphotransferase family protein [Chloroflexota bacterium]
MAEALGVGPDALRIDNRPPLPHQTNHLYDIWIDTTHLIGKVFCDAERRRRRPAAEREYAALHVMWPRGCAPRPVAFQAGTDPLVIYEFAPGAMWDRRVPTRAQLERLADVWLRLAAVPPAQLWPAPGESTPWTDIESRMIGRLEKYVTWLRHAPDRQRTELAELSLEAARHILASLRPLGDASYVPAFCHWDPRFANIIEAPSGALALVDWEDSGVRDPANDVACLLSHPNQEDLLSPSAWSAFLEPYLESRSTHDPTLRARIEHWCGGFAIFWLGLLLDDGISRSTSGNLVDWRINAMEPNQRLRRYLARALAWPDPDFSRQLTELQTCTFFDIA